MLWTVCQVLGVTGMDSMSAEGVKSEEYKVWKEETLAKQTSHKEAEQRTGLWQQFTEVEVKEKDKNEYVVEIAEGCRYVWHSW